MAGLRIAKVAAIHPGGHAVDLTFLDDASRVPFVQVLSTSASSNTGLSDLAAPAVPASGDPYDPTATGNRDVYALCGSLGGLPVVLGFLFPQVCQMLFADMNRRIDRHASDVYTTIDGAGNYEMYHPSGTYLRIGATSAHEDLTGRDVDGLWKITKNTAAAVHVHLSVKNAGSEVASIDIDPSGNLVETNAGTLSATSDLAATVKAPLITLDTPSVVTTGNVVVGTGASGSFTTPTGQVVTVQDGIITDIM